MKLCNQCPTNPTCNHCVTTLNAGDMAKKVIPSRPITLTHLPAGIKLKAELRAISRLSLGIFTGGEKWISGRYEVELAPDFRIIGSTSASIGDSYYMVFDIEKVLRKEEIFERLLLEEFHFWHLSHELEPAFVCMEIENREKEWKELIRQELDKLQIIKQLDDIRMFILEGEQIRPLGDFAIDEMIERDVVRIGKSAQKANEKTREQILSSEQDQAYDITAIPLNNQSCGIAMINITEIITAERERRKEEWDLYQTILSIVTGTKLELYQDTDLYALFRGSEHTSTIPLREAVDLVHVRKAIKEALSKTDLSDKRILHYIVAVNEAATNTIKHGIGGYVQIYISYKEEICRVVIFDEGKGIQLTDLPKAALLKGYSTTESLGVGFHVMLTYADKILLNSSSLGTKIVLELHNIRIK